MWGSNSELLNFGITKDILRKGGLSNLKIVYLFLISWCRIFNNNIKISTSRMWEVICYEYLSPKSSIVNGIIIIYIFYLAIWQFDETYKYENFGAFIPRIWPILLGKKVHGDWYIYPDDKWWLSMRGFCFFSSSFFVMPSQINPLRRS